MDKFNYINKYSLLGMLSKTYIPVEDYNAYIKNKKEICLFNKDLIPKYIDSYEKISILYQNEEEYKDIKNEYKDKISSKYIGHEIISKIDKDFLDFKGKNGKNFRKANNRIKDIKIETECNIEEIIELINKWRDLRDYGMQDRSGHDRVFFNSHYRNEKQNYICLFFKHNYKLIGYSVVYEYDENRYIYVLGKYLPEYGQDLSYLLDCLLFKYIYDLNNQEFLINWGASSSGLLKYKKRFPIFNIDKKYFIKIKNEKI